MKSDVPRSSPSKPVFVAARRLTDSKERQAYLQEACGEDLELRKKVEGLLAAIGQATPSPLDHALEKLGPAQTSRLDTTASEEVDIASHPMIGPYKLLERLGEGGMGTVYMAQQKQPVKRKVALKVIKAGMDSKEVLARFEAERQALAMMDHSNIARIFDGGLTEDRRPYFVMELVRGFAIDKYCDDAKLSLRDRLQLFIDVCRAIQHAHHKGIIHRDLKPSNILITLHDSVPVVKVIDFGIAKALDHELTDRTLFTRFAELVGTPAYMSPEQAEMSGLDIDTRSDVYSLGVLLYKLLVGVTPFDERALKSEGVDEMRRIIREDEPFRPSHKASTLDHEFVSTISDRRGIDPRELSLSMRRELDWIVMRALEKDRDRRYQSASALAADIQRYLDDEPVAACPPSAAYRLRKYARRYKGALTAAALVLLTMMTATGVSIWYAAEANTARQIAHQQLKQSDADYARALNAVDLVVNKVGSNEFFKIRGMGVVRDELLQSAMNLFEQIVAEHRDDPSARRRTADAYARLHMIYRETGLRDKGIEAGEKAIALLEDLLVESPDDLELRTELAHVYQTIAWTKPIDRHERQRLFDRSMALVEYVQQVEATTPAVADAHIRIAYALLFSASFGIYDDPEPAEANVLKAIEMSEDDPLVLASAYRILAGLRVTQGRLNDAEQSARKAISLAREALEQGSDEKLARQRIYLSMRLLANVFEKQGESKAENNMRNDALKIVIQLSADYPDVAVFKRWVLDGRLRNRDEFRVHLEESLKQSRDDVLDSLIQRGREERLRDYALDLLNEGRDEEGEQLLRDVLPLLGQYLVDVSKHEWDHVNYSDMKTILIRRLIEEREFAAAQSLLDNIHFDLGADDAAQAYLHRQRGHNELALNSLNEAVESDFKVTIFLRQRGELLSEMRKWDRAQEDFDAVNATDYVTHYSLYQAALLCLVRNDTPRYETLCLKMLETFEHANSADETNFTAWTCALAPNAIADYAAAINLARFATKNNAGNEQNHTELGAILMRSGQYEPARIELEKAVATSHSDGTSQSYTDYFRAMTEHHLGQEPAARRHLEAANKSADEEFADSPTWNRKLTLELLRSEAEALIGNQKTTSDAKANLPQNEF